jgi:hypothetical protein
MKNNPQTGQPIRGSQQRNATIRSEGGRRRSRLITGACCRRRRASTVLTACRSAWRSLQSPAASALALAVGAAAAAATIPAAALPRHRRRASRWWCVAEEEGVMGSWGWEEIGRWQGVIGRCFWVAISFRVCMHMPCVTRRRPSQEQDGDRQYSAFFFHLLISFY